MYIQQIKFVYIKKCTILALEGASRPSSKLIVNMFSLCTSKNKTKIIRGFSSVAILADHLSRSSTTSVKEEKQAFLLAFHPRSPVLSSWLHNPQPSWNLPLLFLKELKEKLRSRN